MPRGRAISARSLAIWWAKLKINDEVRYSMTQIASLLTVATFFLTYRLHFTVRKGGGLICSRAYVRGGGRNCGLLRYIHV